MSKLDDILDKQYMEGYRDSTRRASGKSGWTHQSKLDIKHLMLELLEDQQPSPSIHDYSHEAVNEHLAWLRSKVEAL